MPRIGMLTSGGDCQALNAAMRGLAKALYHDDEDNEIFGFRDGYKGLIYGDVEVLSEKDFSGILTQGGTILGTSRQPFKKMRLPDDNGLDKVAAMKETYHKLALDCLVILGGNGTHKTAYLLQQEGLNVITLPKTIDNDLWGTEMSFGFQSAVDIAAEAIDRIHTTASAHGRVFIVEIMGHKVGHVALHAGIASGADVILLPEIPYQIEAVVAAIEKRTLQGKRFTIIAVAEGATSRASAAAKEKKAKKTSIAYQLAEEVAAHTQKEVRIAVPGHTQRGGSPSPNDRIFATRCGALAARMVIQQDYGYMVTLQNNQLTKIPLAEVAGRLKKIDTTDDLIQEARLMGISFGD